MFDLSGLYRDRSPSTHSAPVEFVVRKDGKPFAILNATPELAERTVCGFMMAKPGSAWSLERA